MYCVVLFYFLQIVVFFNFGFVLSYQMVLSDKLPLDKAPKRKRGEAKVEIPTTPVCLIRATDGEKKLSTHVILCFCFCVFFCLLLRFRIAFE